MVRTLTLRETFDTVTSSAGTIVWPLKCQVIFKGKSPSDTVHCDVADWPELNDCDPNVNGTIAGLTKNTQTPKYTADLELNYNK